MNGNSGNITPLGAPKPNGGGNGFPGSSASLADKVHAIDLRLARIEESLKHVATKEWILGGVIGAIIAASMVALALLKLFDNG